LDDIGLFVHPHIACSGKGVVCRSIEIINDLFFLKKLFSGLHPRPFRIDRAVSGRFVSCAKHDFGPFPLSSHNGIRESNARE
jgi:hypothetical protein